MVDVSVIIVNYNVRGLLENCINSVLDASKHLNIEIVIVDNNSFDGSVEHICKGFGNNPHIKIIENKINLGFAKANNQGAKLAQGKYLLILNPDTILQEDAIEKAISFYESEIGRASCRERV